jgi:hypothetical protein
MSKERRLLEKFVGWNYEKGAPANLFNNLIADAEKLLSEPEEIEIESADFIKAAQLYTEKLKIVVNNNAYRQGYKYGKASVNRHGKISLRDHFAGLAMQGMMHSDLSVEDTATVAYQQADAMLNERDKGAKTNTKCENGSGEGL